MYMSKFSATLLTDTEMWTIRTVLHWNIHICIYKLKKYV